MNQQKIGEFLKYLRKNKGLTQEQLAEHFCVSSRTVSRWENGNNMPDIDILIELADFYEVDIQELIDGERQSENMDKKTKETVIKAAEYMNMGTEQYTKRVRLLARQGPIPLQIGAVFWFVASLISHTELSNNTVLNAVSEFTEGAAIGMILCGIIFTSRYGHRIRAFKERLFKRH